MPTARVESRIRNALALAAVALGAACGGHGGQTYPRPSDCVVQLVPNDPGPDYVEVGEMSFEAYLMMPSRYQYTNPRVLLAEIRPDICAIGGDTLFAQRNAAGVITHATVYRKPRELEPPPSRPRERPSHVESCEGSCQPGYICEKDACIPACVPACGEGQTCGTDRLCHLDEKLLDEKPVDEKPVDEKPANEKPVEQ